MDREYPSEDRNRRGRGASVFGVTGISRESLLSFLQEQTFQCAGERRVLASRAIWCAHHVPEVFSSEDGGESVGGLLAIFF